MTFTGRTPNLGDPARLTYALSLECAFQATQAADSGRKADALALRAKRLAKDTGDAANVDAAYSIALFLTGRFSASLETADRGRDAILNKNSAGFLEERTCKMMGIWSLAWMGELRELASRVERNLDEAQHRGDVVAQTMLRTGQPNLTWLRRGDPKLARSVADEASNLWVQSGYHNPHYWILLANAQIDLYEGDGEAALRRITADWPRMRRALILEVHLLKCEALFLRGRASLAAARAARGTTRALLLQSASVDARRIRRVRARYSLAKAESLLAGVAFLRGDTDKACEHLRTAATAFDGAAMAMHAAAARLHLGQCIQGDEGRAVEVGARAWFSSQEIADADRMASLVSPAL